MNRDYHSDRDHVSRGDLVTFATSPRKYKRRHDDDVEENDNLRIGTGVHAIALKDVVSLDRVVKIPEKVLGLRKDGSLVRSGKKFNAFRLATVNRGKTLMLPKQWQLCMDVAEAMGRIKFAESADGQDILISDLVNRSDVLRECEHRWEDVLPCRMKADIVLPLPDLTICLDLKTARSVHPRAFFNEIRDRKLWLQDAHYSTGLEEKFGNPVRFCFVACEKSGDFNSEIFELEPSTRAWAREGRLQILERLKACQESGNFVDPPKDTSIKQISLSPQEMGIE